MRITHKQLFSLSGLTAALACACPAFAQDAGDDAGERPTHHLEPVVVTAVAPSAPLTITTDPKLPRQPLPASDGADYLKTIPGFAAIRNGGSNGDPVLRGMSGSRLNILTNGTTMSGACASRMDPATSYISPETFDRLTVIKGPQTVLWGPGASAGTVRFDRDTPRFATDGIRFDGSLTGGNFGRNDQLADLTVGNEQVYTRVTANHSHSQDYKDGDGRRVPSRWDKWNADLALGFTPDTDTLYELSMGTGDGEARYGGRALDGTQFKRESFGMRMEKQHLGGMLDKIEAQLYYNDANHRMDNFTLRSPDPVSALPRPFEVNVSRATWGGRLASTWATSENLSLVTGMDFRRESSRWRTSIDKAPIHEQPWRKDAALSNTGLFGEATWHAAEGRRVIGGARVDRAGATKLETAQRRHKTLPSGFLRYEQDLDAVPVTWYAGLGHAQRFPDFWELIYPGGANGAASAFQTVKPEKTTQLDFGVQYRTDKLDAWFSGYVGKVRDYILFQYDDHDRSRVLNANARIFGGELGVSHSFTPRWTAGATLAYAWARNTSEGRPLPQIPPLEARLSVAYDDGTWSAGALWRLAAPQKRYALNEGNAAGRDFGPTAGFGVLSVNGGHAFSKRVRLSMGIDNLLDKTYSEHLNLAGDRGIGFPGTSAINEPGRTVWARVSVKY